LKRFKTGEYRSALLKKGFKQERATGHDIFCLYVGEKKTQIFTMLSHGSSEDINNPLLNKMKKQLRLSNQEIERFIECPMNHDEFLSTLRRKGEHI
jgi:predicted RNA binding protein YcfA (HicA-like mRNA interferase family)